jgi:hypothetical protein
MWIIDHLARLPSTNVRIAVSLAVVVATAARYLTARDGWEPSLEWLGFLAASLGLDVVQFGVKRRTQNGNGGTDHSPNAPNPPSP